MSIPTARPWRTLPLVATALLAACAPDAPSTALAPAVERPNLGAATAARPAPPTLYTAIFVGLSDYLAGSLRGRPNTHYMVKFYGDQSTCAVGSDGATGVGSVDVVTDASGNATVGAVISAAGFGAITATATDPEGQTSVLSNCVEFIVSGGGAVADVKPDVISVRGTAVVTAALLSGGGFDATRVHPSLVKLYVYNAPRMSDPVSVVQRGGTYNAFVRDLNGDLVPDLGVSFSMVDLRAAGLSPTSVLSLGVALDLPHFGLTSVVGASDPVLPRIVP
jgi:hypothetical protein